MIASISGILKLKKEGWILMETGGIGYKVFAPKNVLDSFKVGEECFLYTYHHIKEDNQALYGFISTEEQDLFELLLSVSGIGPKVALSVMNSATVDELRTAVIEDNSDILTGIAGIGSKTAKRIVLELKNKIKISDVRPVGTKSIDVGSHIDVYEALLRLGYNAVEARAALKMVPGEIKDPDEKLKIALRNLGK